MITEDLPWVFATVGVACVCNGHNFHGVPNEPSRLEGMDQADVMVRDRTLTLAAVDAQAAQMGQGSIVNFNGKAYTVRYPLAYSGDGAVVTATLGSPT